MTETLYRPPTSRGASTLLEEDMVTPSSPVQSTDAYGFLAADHRHVRIEFRPRTRWGPSHELGLWWLKDVADRLQTLIALPANWNSRGARRVTVQAVRTSLVVLLNVMANDSRLPTIVPTVRGGLQLEWHAGGINLEIEIDHTGGDVEVAFEDMRNEIEWDEPLTDFSVVRDAIATLSARYSRH
jgi:hypothetical protein